MSVALSVVQEKTKIEIPIKILPHGVGLNVPSYATSAAAGLDLYAALEAPITLAPMARALIPTGFALALPAGYEAQIRPRSGLALKHGLTCLNSPGTIDADYRGEVQVLLINLGQEPVTLERGMRIAQMVIASYTAISWQLVPELEESARGTGGFGSTGVAAL